MTNVGRTAPTAWEQLGPTNASRTHAVRLLVDRMYELILSDVELRPYFAAPLASTPVDLGEGRLGEAEDFARLKSHQAHTIAAVLGHPTAEAADLGRAHKGLGITRRHYWRVVSYLFEALDEIGAPPGVVEAVASVVWAVRKAVQERA